MTTLERRTMTDGVELRANDDGGSTAVGYAAVFNEWSEDLGGFLEQVAPSAFTKTLAEADIRGLFNHSEDVPLGRVKAGTMRLEADRRGLRYEIDLPDSPNGQNVAEALRRGDITGSSFGFRTIGDMWDEHEDGTPLRTLTEVALRDAGPVTFPAYLGADSALRSLAESRSLDLDALIEARDAGRLADALAECDADRHDTPAALVAPVRRLRRRL